MAASSGGVVSMVVCGEISAAPFRGSWRGSEDVTTAIQQQ